MSRRRIATLTVAAALGALATSPAAQADTVTLGSTLANDFEGGVSTSPTVSVQLSYDPGTSPNPVVSPVNGLITGWKVKSADDGAVYTLKVLRPNGSVSLVTTTNSNFTAIASQQAPSAVPAGTAVATPTGVIFDYPASLPISQGDYVGLLTGGAVDDLPQKTTNGLAQNLIANNFSGQPGDGAAADLLADEQHDLLLQATIEYCTVPKVKKKGRKKATKRIRRAGCSVKVKKKRAKNPKQLRKVVKQKPKPGSTLPPGGRVVVFVGK